MAGTTLKPGDVGYGQAPLNPYNPTNGIIPPSTPTNDPFLSTLKEKLMGQIGIISSEDTNIEKKINEAIAGIKSSTQLANEKVKSEFGRELAYTAERSAAELDSGRSAGVGGIMNMAALRELTQTTDKSLKDLEQRKHELILQNDAAGASKIAELQLSSIEFKQKAEQQIFTNLLGMANLGLGIQQEDRLSGAQSFTERSSIANIALQYGLTVNESDTIDTITARAMPFASEEQKARLAKLKAETAYTNAQANKIISGDGGGVTLDELTLDSLVSSAYNLEKAGKMDEYNNIIAQVTKKGTGALEKFYDAKFKYASAQLQAEKNFVIDQAKTKKSGKYKPPTLVPGYVSPKEQRKIQSALEKSNNQLLTESSFFK